MDAVRFAPAAVLLGATLFLALRHYHHAYEFSPTIEWTPIRRTLGRLLRGDRGPILLAPLILQVWAGSLIGAGLAIWSGLVPPEAAGSLQTTIGIYGGIVAGVAVLGLMLISRLRG